MNPLSWAGLDTQTAARPPKLPRNFRFWRRGWITGMIMGGLLVAALHWLALVATPYCGGW